MVVSLIRISYNVLIEIRKVLIVILFLLMLGLGIYGIACPKLPYVEPGAWTIEVIRWCNIWIVFLGISYVYKAGKHLNVDVLLTRLTERARFVVDLVCNMLAICFFIILLVKGTQLSLLNFSQISSFSGLPVGIAYFALPVGSIYMLVEIMEHYSSQPWVRLFLKRNRRT